MPAVPSRPPPTTRRSTGAFKNKAPSQTLMKDATRYASLKMEEVKARARFVEELHDDSSPFKK